MSERENVGWTESIRSLIVYSRARKAVYVLAGGSVCMAEVRLPSVSIITVLLDSGQDLSQEDRSDRGPRGCQEY